MPILLLFCLFFSLSGLAQQDPFNKQQRQNQSQSENTTPQFSLPSPTCQGEKTALAEETVFAELKLVGIILFKEQATTLWLDPQQQMISADLNQLIGRERLQIEHISKNKVRLQGCQPAKPIFLTL